MTMTRVSFCQKCFSAARPKTNQLFVCWGTKRKGYVVYQALHQGRKGFVPHTFEFKRLVDKTVYYEVACSMVGCGAIANPDKKDASLYSVGFYWDNRSMPLNEWNALVKYKRDCDFQI